MAVSRRALTDLATSRLETIANATHYFAEIPETPPTVGIHDPRVLAYSVLWPTPGALGDESESLDGLVDDLDWRFTVSCVAGIPDLLMALVDQVDQKLNGWEPTVNGFAVGRCELDFDTGIPRQDVSFTPIRLYLQLPYRLRIGA